MAIPSPFEATVGLAKQVAAAVWKHYVQLIAGFVVVAIASLVSFLLGLNSADLVTIASKQDKFGAHCFRPIVDANMDGNPGFTLKDVAIKHALVCGSATEQKDTPAATLQRYVNRYDSCFSYSAASNNLSLYAGTPSKIEEFTNANNETTIACNCEAGQAKLIATHKTKSGQWCGIDAPDPAEM